MPLRARVGGPKRTGRAVPEVYASHGQAGGLPIMLPAGACRTIPYPGANGPENPNGRLRRDLPRDLDLDALGDAGQREVVSCSAAT